MLFSPFVTTEHYEDASTYMMSVNGNGYAEYMHLFHSSGYRPNHGLCRPKIDWNLHDTLYITPLLCHHGNKLYWFTVTKFIVPGQLCDSAASQIALDSFDWRIQLYVAGKGIGSLISDLKKILLNDTMHRPDVLDWSTRRLVNEWICLSNGRHSTIPKCLFRRFPTQCFVGKLQLLQGRYSVSCDEITGWRPTVQKVMELGLVRDVETLEGACGYVVRRWRNAWEERDGRRICTPEPGIKCCGSQCSTAHRSSSVPSEFLFKSK